MESSKRRKISAGTSSNVVRAVTPGSSKRKEPVRLASASPTTPAPSNTVANKDNDNEEVPAAAAGVSETAPEIPADDDNITFRDLGVADSLCDACTSLGYTKPTPIQRQSIPHSLQGKDVIGLAETGSGKTVAFALPILQALLDKPQPFHSLVLAPTRELAVQISDAFQALGAQISLRTACLVGGLDMTNQAMALGKKPHVIVATPGRLLDHLERTKNFSLRNLRYLVLDEADRLLDMDFGDIIDKILKFIPRERRSLLFSATMSSKVESLQRASLRDPIRVETKSNKYQTVKSLVQSYLFVAHKNKSVYLVHLMNEFAGKQIIIFMRLVQETQRLALMLRALGFASVPLHGQLNQTARLGALNKFKSGSRNILVATDVAARGLDIPAVDLVINYDLPQDSKTYVHRVGRTARAGLSGQAITIATQYDIEILKRTETALGFQLPEFKHEKEEVMVFRARTEQAERHSRQEMKQLMENAGQRGSVMAGRHRGARGARRADNMDAEEG